MEPHTLTERAWVGAAIKAGRQARGLKQRELVELTQAAGLSWTQGILAKVEVGTRDVTLAELLIVCICLGTTPSELLYAEEVVPDYVELPSGKKWSAGAVGELLDGNPLTGELASAWSLPNEPRDVVRPDDVLELASMYLDDPDAVELSELTGLELEEVSERVSRIASGLIAAAGLEGRRRKRWTARELIDTLLEATVGEVTRDGKQPSEYAVRALRVGIVRDVAEGITRAEGGKR